MKDVQNEQDTRNVSIDKVGVSGVSWPVTVMDRQNGTQETVAEVALSVSLPHHYRGTHMSRFVELLSAQEKNISLANMKNLLMLLKEKLNAEEAQANFSFPYFITKAAPVSGAKGRVRYDVVFDATLSGEIFDVVITLIAPVQTLCPCSKEISDFGAHNQRAHAKISVRMNGLLWLEELAEMVDSCASAPVYSLLKREDEKFVTERAYETPRFVEDFVREMAILLQDDSRVTWFNVSVTSHESIHNHDAFASIERRKSSVR